MASCPLEVHSFDMDFTMAASTRLVSVLSGSLGCDGSTPDCNLLALTH